MVCKLCRRYWFEVSTSLEISSLTWRLVVALNYFTFLWHLLFWMSGANIYSCSFLYLFRKEKGLGSLLTWAKQLNYWNLRSQVVGGCLYWRRNGQSLELLRQNLIRVWFLFAICNFDLCDESSCILISNGFCSCCCSTWWIFILVCSDIG